MSAGTVHTKSSLILAGGFLIGGLVARESTLGYIVGSLIGIFINPDNDVDAGTVTHKYLRKRLGWWAEMLWNIIWRPYRKSLKHGGDLSHFPVISTLGRIAYLFFFLVVIPEIILYFIFPMNFLYEIKWWINVLLINYRVVIGLMAADLIHYVLDVSTVEHANKNRPVRNTGLSGDAISSFFSSWMQ